MAEVPKFADRLAGAALTVRPLKMLLTLLSLPFYVLGWLLGLLFVALLFAVGAVKVGITDARAKVSLSPVGDG